MESYDDDNSEQKDDRAAAGHYIAKGDSIVGDDCVDSGGSWLQ